MTQPVFFYPLRLVVYCNDGNSRIKDILHQKSEFKVFEARTLNDAYVQAETECCHVAIVNYEEIKRSFSLNTEEIFQTLSKNFHFARIFVICGPTIPISIARSAQDAGIRLLHIGKRDLETLSSEISSIANGFRANNLNVEWNFPPGTNIPTLFNQREEVNWVFSQLLLPRASNLRLYELKGRGNSGVLRGRIDDLSVAALIKIGQAAKIKREIENYDTFIYRQLGATYHALIEQKYNWWNIGGILYTFLGENKDMMSFSRYYQSRELRDVPLILATLDFLYDTVLKPLYRGINQRMLHASLYDAYDESLQLSERLTNFIPTEIGFGLPNPINWLKLNKASSHLQRENIPTYQAITHGDLWGENILVDGSHCWIIDYERTGWGHILRDFAELEVDIFSRLSQIPESDIGVVYELAIALSNPVFVSNNLPYWTPQIQYHREAQKAFHVINRIRYHADRIAQYADMREYYWALLLDAVFLATISWKDPWQRKRALLFASVLCGRLDYWGEKDWPPAGWQKVDWIQSPFDINMQSPTQRQSESTVDNRGNVTNIHIGNITVGEGANVGDIVLASEIQKSFNKAESANIQVELKEALKQLAEAVNAMNKSLPEELAAEAVEDLSKLVDEATKSVPSKKWYSVSIDGLIKAAENVGKIGEPVINLSRKVLSLLTGGIVPS